MLKFVAVYARYALTTLAIVGFDLGANYSFSPARAPC